MAKDTLPLHKAELEPSVLDPAENVDPAKINTIQAALDQHKSEGGNINPNLQSALDLARSLLTPPKK